MSSLITPVGGPATPAALQEEAPPRAQEPSKPAPKDREAALRQSAHNRVVLGGRVAEFSYDQRLDRIVVRVMSGESPPREIVRQIPSEEYLHFISRFREMLGVLLNEQF